jgi:hypothetical protein
VQRLRFRSAKVTHKVVKAVAVGVNVEELEHIRMIDFAHDDPLA